MTIALKHLFLIAAVIALATSAYGQGQPAQKETASAKTISGKITSTDNQPLANARISMGRAFGNTFTANVNVRIDNDGSFTTPPLEPGLYFFSVIAPGL